MSRTSFERAGRRGGAPCGCVGRGKGRGRSCEDADALGVGLLVGALECESVGVVYVVTFRRQELLPE